MSGASFICPKCGYEVGPAAADSGPRVCPECGQEFQVLDVAGRVFAPKPAGNVVGWIMARWVLLWAGITILLAWNSDTFSIVTRAAGWLALGAMTITALITPLTQSEVLSQAHERAPFRRRYRVRLLIFGWGLNFVLVSAAFAVFTAVSSASGVRWW